MSVIRARLAESSTWARFGHSLFALAWLPVDYPLWCRVIVGALAIVVYLVAACIPDPKP